MRRSHFSLSPSAAESDAFPPIFIRIWKSWRTAICIVTDESVPARSRKRKLADVAEEMKLSPIKRVFFTVLHFFLDSCYIFFSYWVKRRWTSEYKIVNIFNICLT